jgi:hypothetical protein
LSIENPKENSIIPNENKVFQENRKFSDYFQRKRLFIYQNTEDLFTVGQAVCEGRRSFEKLSTDIKHAADQLFFKPKTFLKALDFSIVG